MVAFMKSYFILLRTRVSLYILDIQRFYGQKPLVNGQSNDMYGRSIVPCEQ